MDSIVLTQVPYDHSWPTLFQKEKDILLQRLSPRLKISRIEHIGSTSVEGLSAKPYIDIQIFPERKWKTTTVGFSNEATGNYP
jgi:GrpB-like predicted nucleotidyltransferase (UPF0157 family)